MRGTKSKMRLLSFVNLKPAQLRSYEQPNVTQRRPVVNCTLVVKNKNSVYTPEEGIKYDGDLI